MDIIEAILQLPDQCQQAWEDTRDLDVPEHYKKTTAALFCGMGGSALGAHIVQSVFDLNRPFVIHSNYDLPEWVNDPEMVILSSYSGNTEEVLSSAKDAWQDGCKIAGLTSGGKLAKFLEEHFCARYIFDPKYNTTGQPRLGLGYGIFGLLRILQKTEYLWNKNIESEVTSSIIELKNIVEDVNSQAKDFAGKLSGKYVTILGADHLVGNAHVFANQTNESSKSYSSWYAIPEANHHLLEGLKHPKIDNVVVFIESTSYKSENIKRVEITKEVFAKNNVATLTYTPKSSSKFAQALEALLFSSLVTAYLGQEYGEDSLAIPNVDYFKKKME